MNTETAEIDFNPYENVVCCICGEKIPWIDSHNPWPVVDDEDSRCCSVCNFTKVIPARIVLSRHDGLLPCPYCGGSAIIREKEESGELVFTVMCAECTASTASFDTPEDAAAAWNRRV